MRSSPSATLRDVLRKADPFYHRATCSGEEMKKKEREVEREALLGELCVDVPVLKELYQATKGSETWLSENRVQTNRLLYEADQKAVLEREGMVRFNVGDANHKVGDFCVGGILTLRMRSLFPSCCSYFTLKCIRAVGAI